jgi:hypothetical protein
MSVHEFRLIFEQYFKIYNHTKQYNAEIFKLLVHFLVCEGEANGKNQMEVYRLIFESRNPLIIEISDYSEQLYIGLFGKKYEIREFITSFPREASVLAAQINFFTYLTFDRNYVCSKMIKEIFPIQILLSYIKADMYSEIKASLINVFTHSYLNEKPRFPKRLQKVFPLHGIRTE